MRHHLARFWKLWLCAIALSGGIGLYTAEWAPSSGHVGLRIKAEDRQPVGMPIIIHVQIQNVGDKPISWWCGIGSQLPGAMNFRIESKHQGDTEWRVAKATNHETDEGSGINKTLKSGESLLVPLVVTVRPQSVSGHVRKEPIFVDTIDVRVTSALDASNSTSEAQIMIYHDPRLIEQRQFQMIRGIVDADNSFWHHVAIHHADAVVVDAAYNLSEVDNRLVSKSACQVLANQSQLSEGRAEDLTRLMRKWAARGDLDYSVIATALATQSELARKTAFELLVETKNDITPFRVMDALRMSPGDAEWLKRVRAEIEGFQNRGIKNERLAHDSHLAISWINQRLANLQR